LALPIPIPRTFSWLCGALLLVGMMLGDVLGGAPVDWDFALIKSRAQALYGPLGEGQQRIDDWQRLLANRTPAGDVGLLNRVNRFFNQRVRYVEDVDLWHQVDYWETPIEALWKGAGDCEDYAIAKYFSLRHLGVASDKLRITYVKALRLNRAHMVLTYYASPDAMPLVLDSLIDDIQPASQRTDLLPVYSFNAEGLWLPGAKGNQKVSDTKRLSRWQELLKRMQAEGFPVETTN